MPAFPQAWLDELHARNDIVEVIGNYVPLTLKSGRYWGLCPFHGEKTASFSVSADKQLYYCFGCHVGGDVIHFVRTMEKLSYMEAIQLLANRASLTLPETINDRGMQEERDLRERLYQINREAARFFFQELLGQQGEKALAYLQERGIQAKTVQAFGLGYAAQSGQRLNTYLKSKGYTLEDMQLLGLVKKSEDRFYDGFRNRLIFPIIARNKQVIGFGGRVIEQQTGGPKYLNSPESTVFSKRRNLYGLNLLRGKTLEALILVEGYMDVISLFQAGVTGAVATLGTALTPQQARLIKSYAGKVYMAYDGDTAGQNATLKGIDILQKEGIDVNILSFPAGQDPDDFARIHGKNGFDALFNAATSSNAYKLERIRDRFDLSTMPGREAYAKEGAVFIQKLSPVEQELYFTQLSGETDFSVETLRQEGNIAVSKQAREDVSVKMAPTISLPQISEGEAGYSKQRLRTERSLIAAAVSNTDAMGQVIAQIALFEVPPHVAFLRIVQEEPEASLVAWMSRLSEEDVSFVSIAVNATIRVYDSEEVGNGLHALRRLQLAEKIEQLQKESEEAATLVSRKIECVKEIRLLNEILENMDGIEDERNDEG